MRSCEQWVRTQRFSGPYPGETVHAHYVQHRFARHAHEHLVIGLVEKGVQQYTYQGSRYRTYAGQIFFVDGGEPHTGEAADEDGYVYRTLCLNPRVLAGIAREVTDREGLPHFCNAVITDRPLFTKLLGLHRAVGSGASTMYRESLLLEVVADLLRTHVEPRRQSVTVGRDEVVVRQLRDYIEAHYFEDVSLTQLGTVVSRSPYHTARVFSKICGLPPHAYLESIRIQRARELLAAGASVVETALAVGYPDQSHFTHRFRRHTGMTPRHYRDAGR